MQKAEICRLIAENPAAHEVGAEMPETARKVFCTVKSIGMQEAYQAMGQGLNPELKVILKHDFEYRDEPFLEMNGRRYKIIRTYITEADGVELTCQRVTGNAREVE